MVCLNIYLPLSLSLSPPPHLKKKKKKKKYLTFFFIDLLENYGKMIEASDGYAQVYPEHKFLIVEAYRRFIYIYNFIIL